MKNFFYLLCVGLVLYGIPASSQTCPRQPESSFTLHQADSIKQAFSQVGFIVVKETSISMNSAGEMQVMVSLMQENRYQFIFIADTSSTSSELKLYSGDEKQVAYSNTGTESAGNVISYSFTPQSPGLHLLKPSQVNNKTKTLYGHFILLKKVSDELVKL